MTLSKNKYLTSETATVGMKVMLANPRPSYNLGRNNPAEGTLYECIGEITEVMRNCIDVLWKNGTNNGYHDNTLREVTDIPEGNVKSIWE